MNNSARSEDQLNLSTRARIICLLIAVGGAILGIVLTQGYYDHVIGGQVTGCSITSYVDCDKVSSSDFATVAGVPLSVLGFAFHIFLIGLFSSGFLKRTAPGQNTVMATAMLFSTAGAVISVVLAVISLAVIRALCIYCTMLQILNVAVFVILLMTIRGGGPGRVPVRVILSGLKPFRPIVPLIAAAIALAGGVLLTWGMEQRDLAVDDAKPAGNTARLINQHFNTAVREFTTNDSPTLGTSDLGIQIVVFSDYNCIHCMDLDRDLQRLVEDFDEKIELVFKFFPLDGDCNPFVQNEEPSSSCEAAAAAYVAYEQRLFWEYHNELFEHFQEYTGAQLVEYAGNVGFPNPGVLEERAGDEFVTRRLYLDILEGVVAEVSYTPTVFLNGRRLESFRGPEDSQYLLLKDTIEELTGR